MPSSSNDLSVDLFVINDNGVSIYKPSTERLSLVEIKDADDYGKIIKWYRESLIKISDKRPDVSWPSSPEGTKIVNATGPGQYNLNRPGSTWLLPVGDVGLEWFNQLLSSYEWSGFYLMDPDTNEPAGCADWIRPGFLEVGFPIPAFDELALMLHAGQAGAIVQNIRLASEALGIGAWMTGSYADDLVLGAYPEVAKGLGFNFISREGTLNPSTTTTCIGLKGVKEAVAVPTPRFKDAEAAVRYVADLRNNSATPFSASGPWKNGLRGPYEAETMESIKQNPRSYVADWAVEAAIATVDYIVKKYGCAPAYISPMRAKLSVQVHHVDPNFYRRYQGISGEPYALTDSILNHFPLWHPGHNDPAQNNNNQ
ncbi:MAG: hypothetical protein HKL80_03840 [Acidimicrobiales bacterium]|nr:hypothetical protein [Acidimicrobiales bacterium]